MEHFKVTYPYSSGLSGFYRNFIAASIKAMYCGPYSGILSNSIFILEKANHFSNLFLY